jgi:hypothetical protein
MQLGSFRWSVILTTLHWPWSVGSVQGCLFQGCLSHSETIYHVNRTELRSLRQPVCMYVCGGGWVWWGQFVLALVSGDCMGGWLSCHWLFCYRLLMPLCTQRGPCQRSFSCARGAFNLCTQRRLKGPQYGCVLLLLQCFSFCLHHSQLVLQAITRAWHEVQHAVRWWWIVVAFGVPGCSRGRGAASPGTEHSLVYACLSTQRVLLETASFSMCLTRQLISVQFVLEHARCCLLMQHLLCAWTGSICCVPGQATVQWGLRVPA